MTKNKKESYLTLNDKKNIDNMVILSVLFGMCAASLLMTLDDFSYPIGNKIFFTGVGFSALYFMSKRLKAVSGISEEQS